jgi:hypothetical protein
VCRVHCFTAARRRVLALCCAGVVAVIAGVVGCAPASAPPRPCPSDPVLTRSLRDLSQFTKWLERYHVRGYIGEVGWPGTKDAAEWNRVGQGWYAAADRAHLWVTAWSAAELWPQDYPLAIYRGSHDDLRLHIAGPQAAVVTAHPSTALYLRGVNDADGAFGAEAATYSNTRPGRDGTDYRYDSAASFRYLADHGVRLVRLAFTWERIQPRLAGSLDAREVGRLRAAVVAAHAVGLEVVLDLHNSGGYHVATGGAVRRVALGSPELPAIDLVDVWTRLSTAFRGVSGIAGYDLMNEPHDLPGPADGRGGATTWERVSQQTVSALRAHGDRTTVVVEGYAYASVAGWDGMQPRPWINDPAGRVRYEAHQYFDQDHSGVYAQPYGAVRAAAARDAGRGCR